LRISHTFYPIVLNVGDQLLISYCLSVCLSVHVTLCGCATWRSGSALVVESCAVVFLAWHFLFNSSDSFAVQCIV